MNDDPADREDYPFDDEFDDDQDGEALGGVVAQLLTDDAAPAGAGPNGKTTANDAEKKPAAKKPPPPLDHPLAKAFATGRPPWAWGNLKPDEIEVLEAILDHWIIAYNDEYVTDATALIPACWRQHPPVVHELPVIYWAWWFSHHYPKAAVATVVGLYDATLPHFQQRLPRLLGGGATSCRKGRHSDGLSDEFVAQRDVTADKLLADPGSENFATRASTAFPSVAQNRGQR